MRWLAALLLLAGCATQAPPPEVVTSLAPSGRLVAAINFGNPTLATRNALGAPAGLSVDLAAEAGRRLGVPVELKLYQAAGKVVEGIAAREWDIAFFAIDPARAADIDFTPPYLLIEGAYLVRGDSPIAKNEDVDRAGVEVVVGQGSAYDLHLSRALQAATLVRAPTSPRVVDVMLAGNHAVAAGVRQQLEADARRLPGMKVLDGRFLVIRQAMAVPKGRDAARRWLEAFVEDAKASGFIAASLKRHGVDGVRVAPAGNPP